MTEKLKIIFNKISTILKKYYLVFLGLCLFIFLIWLRYIRSRLPKEIPFPYLSVKGFIVTVVICCAYILILKALIKPSSKTNLFSEYIVPLLYMPLESLDHFIKQYFSSEKFILYLADKLTYYIKNTNIFYISLAIIPRIILVTVLCLDVFCFNKLHYIYYFLYFTILLFLNKYIIYSFKIIKKQLIDKVKPMINNGCITTDYVPGIHPDDDPEDEDYDPFQPTMSLPLEIFIDFYTQSLVKESIMREYSFVLSAAHAEKFKINIAPTLNTENQSDYDWDWTRVRHEKNIVVQFKISKILALACLIEYYNITHNDNKILKKIKIVIFSLYLICWSYMLIKNTPNLDILATMKLLSSLSQIHENPFTGEINNLPFRYILTHIILWFHS